MMRFVLKTIVFLLCALFLFSGIVLADEAVSSGSEKSSSTNSQQDQFKNYTYEKDIRNKGTAAWTIWHPAKEDRAEIIEEIIRITNEYRENQGLEPLKKYGDLNKAGNIRAQEQALVFGHTRPDGRSWSTIAKDVDYKGTSIGENCGKLSKNFFERDEDNATMVAELLMEEWENSPTHSENMLNEKYTRIGVGLFVSKDGMGNTTYYCVQMLGS